MKNQASSENIVLYLLIIINVSYWLLVRIKICTVASLSGGFQSSIPEPVCAEAFPSTILFAKSKSAIFVVILSPFLQIRMASGLIPLCTRKEDTQHRTACHCAVPIGALRLARKSKPFTRPFSTSKRLIQNSRNVSSLLPMIS